MLFEFTFAQIMSLSVCLITQNTLGKKIICLVAAFTVATQVGKMETTQEGLR